MKGDINVIVNKKFVRYPTARVVMVGWDDLENFWNIHRIRYRV